MAGKRALSSGDKYALVLAARGDCYNPECHEPLMTERDGRPVANFVIAHVRDELPPADPASDIGWRYWPADDMTVDQRNHFSNLLLLCAPCHKLIDKIDPRTYTVELLHEWKRTNEGERGAELAGTLGSVDQDTLEDLLGEVLRSSAFDAVALGQVVEIARRFQQIDTMIDQTVKAVAVIDAELATHRPVQLRHVVEGRIQTLHGSIAPATERRYREQAIVVQQSAAREMNAAIGRLREELAAAVASSRDARTDGYCEWLDASVVAACTAATTLGQMSSVEELRAGAKAAHEALATLLRGDSPPAIPDPATPAEPEDASSGASVTAVHDLDERARAGHGTRAVAGEMLADLAAIGHVALRAEPVQFVPAVTAMAVWAAHFADLLDDVDAFDAIAWVRSVEPFEYRMSIIKQLWHLRDDDGDAQAAVAGLADEQLAAESAACPEGLLGRYAPDPMWEALAMWPLWAGDPSGANADIAKSLAAGQLCSVLLAFSQHWGRGLTFRNRMGPTTDPLPAHTAQVTAAIAEHFGPELAPAERLPCWEDAADHCRALAREYLLITRAASTMG